VTVVMCGWGVAGRPGLCPRRATVYLRPVRPCGHAEGLAPSCPGHAEAVVGTAATRATRCHECGEVNRPESRADRVEFIPSAK
jgi:hypothetical protein